MKKLPEAVVTKAVTTVFATVPLATANNVREPLPTSGGIHVFPLATNVCVTSNMATSS